MGGIATRVAVLTSLVALVATATVGFLVYQGAQDSLIEAASNGVAHTAETIKVRTWGTVSAISDDVRFLARTPPVQGIVRARMLRGLDPEWAIRDDEWGVQLAQTFRAFLESRPEYLQARLVGLVNDGREMVRVERIDGEVLFANVADFETLGDSAFVKEAAGRPAGNVYLADITWQNNVGGSTSRIPVIRLSTPVHAESGEAFGVVSVTVDVRTVMSAMSPLVNPNQTLYLAAGRGELLHVSSPNRPTPSDLASVGLDELFPDLLPVVDSSTSSIRLLETRLQDDTDGIAYFERVRLDGRSGSPALWIGVSEPHDTILAGVRSVRNSSAVITILLALAAVGLALATSRHMTNPIEKISAAVASFGDDREPVALPVDRDDEIGLLARSFQSMKQQIQEQIEYLEDEEHRQRTIFDTAAEGIIVADTHGRIEAFNAAAERIFDERAQNAIGRAVTSFIPSIDLATGTIDGKPVRPPGVETVGTVGDGSTVPISVIWSSFEWRDEPKCTIFLQDVTERKQAEEARERLVRELESERKSLRELSTTLEARVHQRTAELERLNRELKASNRELRDIAMVASHDLQEPLRKLRSFADLLEAEYGELLDTNGRFYAQRIFTLAERMSRLLTDLMAFSGVTGLEYTFRKVDLQAIAREVIEGLDPIITKTGATVRLGDLPEIDAVPRQMRELFEHLVGNALAYHRPNIAAEVCVRADVEREPAGRRVCQIVVKDNGIGFDQKYVDRIFAPFERLHTRQVKEGTGMGLTICRRIAENHRGSISATSTPGQGSVFVVTLPIEHAA